MGWRSLPTVAGRPSIVTISSVGLMFETDTEQGLKALPLMWLVHALQTPSPHPYFGPVTPSRSRSTHSKRTSSSQSTETCLPLSVNVWTGTVAPCLGFSYGRLSVGDSGSGGTVGYGVKPSGCLWLIG